MTKTILIAAASALALASCTTSQFDGASGNSGNRNTTAGAVTGGVIGGILAGPVTGGSGGRAAAGAVAGAAIGGLIGQQLDRQARELDAELGDQITVTNQGDQLLVNFPQDILFAVDSATVGSSARSDLRALAANLQRYPDTNVTVIGHTDNTGSAGYNFELSTRRAGSVAGILVNSGVSGARITSIGRGEDAPVASNLTPEGRAQNRRVEVIIRPATTG
jgi:outer membrane protein OmpA-like peptidoglycan-associated protein